MTDRLLKIRLQLHQDKKVSVNELSRRYGVSKVSIRHDLSVLEKEGCAKRIYGGAILSKNLMLQTPIFLGENAILDSIARKACEEIQDGDIIILGSGFLCCYLAKLLGKFRNLTVLTNNISALPDLLNLNIHVFMLGGEICEDGTKLSQTVVEEQRSFLNTLYATKAFTEADGIDLHAGITLSSAKNVYMYSRIPEICKTWYMLADHSCFSHVCMFQAAKLTDMHHLVTDQLPFEYQSILKKNGIHIHIAAP